MAPYLRKTFTLCIVLALELCHGIQASAQPGTSIREYDFANLCPGAILLDGGKLNLYRYREYEGLKKTFGEAQSVGGALALLVFDGVRDYYYVQYHRQFETIDLGHFSNKRIQKGFIENVEKWFADDTLLVDYVRAKNLGYSYLPYLVRMYNGHAPRPFDPDFASVPTEFIPDGLVDDRDGRSYDITLVNDVTWMAENLHFCNPTNSNYQECLKFESLGYNWEAASRVCPSGWRLPDESDWKTLLMEYGLPVEKAPWAIDLDVNGDVGRRMLKDSVNSKGFNVIQNKNGGALWWTFEEIGPNKAYSIEIWQPLNKVVKSTRKKSEYVNVRCVK